MTRGQPLRKTTASPYSSGLKIQRMKHLKNGNALYLVKCSRSIRQFWTMQQDYSCLDSNLLTCKRLVFVILDFDWVRDISIVTRYTFQSHSFGILFADNTIIYQVLSPNLTSSLSMLILITQPDFFLVPLLTNCTLRLGYCSDFSIHFLGLQIVNSSSTIFVLQTYFKLLSTTC